MRFLFCFICMCYRYSLLMLSVFTVNKDVYLVFFFVQSIAAEVVRLSVICRCLATAWMYRNAERRNYCAVVT